MAREFLASYLAEKTVSKNPAFIPPDNPVLSIPLPPAGRFSSAAQALKDLIFKDVTGGGLSVVAKGPGRLIATGWLQQGSEHTNSSCFA